MPDLFSLLTTVPSAPPSLRGGRSVKLAALVAVRDEMRYLPGLLDNIAPHVDGIVAFDDGSTDGSAELLRAHPLVIDVLSAAPGRSAWDEPGNHRRLVGAALAHGFDWALAIDADERVERDFRVRAERVLRRGGRLGLSAYAIHLRELWGSPVQFRSDGIWGRKWVARLFALRDDSVFDDRPLHSSKAPLPANPLRVYPKAALELFHLRMLHEPDRLARRRRYELADPEARWQPKVGYAYLTDETNLRLRRVPRRRLYEPLPPPP